AEPRALALEQRFERRLVGHPFEHFHVGGWIVAPAHPAAADAGLLFDLEEHLLDQRPKPPQPRQLDPVVDVVVQTGITARASPPALSTTTPPLKSCPALSSVPAGAWTRTMRRLTSPRYCARA